RGARVALLRFLRRSEAQRPEPPPETHLAANPAVPPELAREIHHSRSLPETVCQSVFAERHSSRTTASPVPSKYSTRMGCNPAVSVSEAAFDSRLCTLNWSMTERSSTK